MSSLSDVAPLEFELIVDSPDGPVQHVRVRGEVDLATAPELRALLGELIEAGRLPLVLDLAECEFMDSTGIQAILVASAAAAAADSGRPMLAVAAPMPSVARVLQLTEIHRLVPVFEALPEAVAALGSLPSPSHETKG